MKHSGIYTRKGDAGMTSLVDGSRVKKIDARLEAYGTVDELNAQLGLLIAMLETETTLQVDFAQDLVVLTDVQRMLFAMGAVLATPGEELKAQSSELRAESLELAGFEEATAALEEAIDVIDGEIGTAWKGFILPGGTRAAALAHVCRTVCRRAERRIFTLAETVKVDETMTAYVNRLSDYLFVLAKKINFLAGKEEKYWKI